MHSVKERMAATGDVEDALGHTLCHVGRSIVINGATLTAGFGVYLAASMQSMQRLAILVVLTITLSLLADLVFTPALIRVAFRGAQRART
jgi:predicted RND superfamily exporter protein